MRRVLDRPEQADGDRLDALPREPGQRRARGVLVQRAFHLAFGCHPLGNLGREHARYVGLERVDTELEGVQLAALAIDQDVGKALGHQQGGLRRVAGDDGVGRPGRAVDQHVRRTDQRLDRDAHGARPHRRARLDAVGATRGRGRRLADGERAARRGNDDVGEGAAGIDGDSVGHGGAPRRERSAHSTSSAAALPARAGQGWTLFRPRDSVAAPAGRALSCDHPAADRTKCAR